MTPGQQAALLYILSKQVQALAQEKRGAWRKLVVRNVFEGREEKTRLQEACTLWVEDLNARNGLRYVENSQAGEVGQVLETVARHALQYGSNTLMEDMHTALQQVGLDREYVLGISDRETEYSGVEHLYSLDHFLNANLANDTGLQLPQWRHLAPTQLDHLDFEVDKNKLNGAYLDRLARDLTIIPTPARRLI